jgi:predicted Rossmann fold nucleotide-binding protein DprA/Smf involved in DNA uptake
MKLALRADAWLERGSPAYPRALERLGPGAPTALAACGSPTILACPLLALFCSVGVPGDLVLRACDLARLLRDAGRAVIGGFQSPLERECLDSLLRGASPVVVCPARGIEGMRVPASWRAPLEEGRLLVLSPFPPLRRRATAEWAEERNRMVAALAERVVILYATPGGRLHRLAVEAVRWKKPVLCLDHPGNRELLVLGAEPASAAALAR